MRILLVGLGLSVIAAGAARADGDPAKGKTVFGKCMACHIADKDQNKIGPYLHGVVGRKSGSVPGFAYSEGMKNLNVTWDEANLDKWLTNPKAMVSGTKMIFPGLPNKTDRDNVIAYLKEEGSK